MRTFENSRDMLVTSEREINEARAKREDAEREEARAVRSRLEKASPSGARVGLVDILNGVSSERSAVALPGLDAISKLRADQALGRRTAEQHNRTYARLEKAARGVHSAPSGFNFDARDPGNYPSRFSWNDRYDPPRRVPIVADAEGRLRGDGRDGPGEGEANDGSDHWADGEVSSVQAEFLLDAARALIEAVRAGRANFPKGRSDDYGRPK